MLNMIMVLTGFFLIFLFGYKLSRILIPLAEGIERIALGYLLGIGVFTLVWFLLNRAGISYTLASGLVLLLALNLILIIIDRFFGKAKKTPFLDLSYFARLNPIEKVLIGIILFLLVTALIQTLYWPIRYWDAMTLYDFRAHLFAQTGTMTQAITFGGFFGYPLLTSLAHTFVYLMGGGNPSFIYSLFYISFLVVMFCSLKKLDTGRTSTLFLTALVAVSPRLFDHVLWAYTNLPYSIYIVLGSIYLYLGIKNKNFGEFAISALLVGLSTWTRTEEPFWLSCIALAVVFSLLIKKWVWPLIYSILVGLLMLPWREFQAVYKIHTANVVGQVVSTSQIVATNLQFSVIKPAFDYVAANVIQMYLIFFLLFGIVFFIKLVIKSREWFLVLFILFDLVLTFAGTVFFVKYITYWREIPDSLSRMVMFMPPLIIFLAGELLSELKKR